MKEIIISKKVIEEMLDKDFSMIFVLQSTYSLIDESRTQEMIVEPTFDG
jgi:hypothetical protein